ncbi:leucine-rich repeat and immunoglobulin-like domain-containing nogo receptor-interacting protein 2 [Ornithodoros turicata]|uniref:leucine-rich repeat and immunoglobulin-like domain-containing nogo receptor-interacting protein 2 n=1 Tax=Ornithodoros turicata TaxID=34597 RepID=UPI0031392318
MRHKGPTRGFLTAVATCLLVGLSNAIVPLGTIETSHPSDFPAPTLLPCPSQCSCQISGEANIFEVSCSAMQLDAVPSGLPPQTTSVDLSRNKIARLDYGVPNETRVGNLRILNLQKNLLTVLGNEDFRNFRNLRILSLRDNVIYSIHENAFTDLQMLVHLDLSNNRIDHLKHEWFQNLNNLVSLDLSRNKISELSNVVFWSLHKLERLQVSENRIQSVGLLSLKGLHSLQHLNVTHNQISQIQGGTLRATCNLKTLDISHNPMVTLSRAFEHGSNVTALFATHMTRLRLITSDSFFGLENLERLLLTNCPSLQAAEQGSFLPLKSLEKLDLSFNNFTTLPAKLLNPLRKLQEVHLSGNPWHCDCRLHWLLLWLRDNVNLHLLSPSTTLCDKPENLSSITVLDSVDKHMVCVNASVVKHTDYAHFRLGSSALLQCEVSGSPEPSLTWITPHNLSFNWTRDRGNVSGTGKFAVLDNGDLLIRHVQRGDSGYYKCVAANALSRAGIFIHLTLDYDFLIDVKIVSILVGCATAAGFVVLTVISIIVQKILFRLGVSCGGSPRARQLYCVLESLESYRCQQLERLREHYNGQANRIKENCVQQMERLRDSYSSQAERLRDIRDYGTSQLDRLRENYYGQVQRVRDYGTGQIDRLRENYVCQRSRVRKFSAQQLYKLRENYKLQQQHLNKILENLNLESCRSVCMRTDSIVFDTVDIIAPPLDVLPPPLPILLIDELDSVSQEGSAYFTPDNLSEVSPDEVARQPNFPPEVAEESSARSSDTTVNLNDVPLVVVPGSQDTRETVV